MSAVQIREAAAADAPGVRRLFARVFGTEMSAGEWDWKFALNPDGWLGTVAVRDGEVVGNYAGWAMRFRLEGEERLVYSVGDVATDPCVRALGGQVDVSIERLVHRSPEGPRMVGRDPDAVILSPGPGRPEVAT